MISRRRLLAGLGAGLLAPAALAVPAEAGASFYSHVRTDLRIPAGQWVRLGAVQARRGDGLYVAQLALDKPKGAGIARLRFTRNWNDGTGDQTYALPPRAMTYNITHLHTVSGFPGIMGTQLLCTVPVTVRWRILKSRQL